MIKLIFKAFYEFILVLIRWLKEVYLFIKEDFIKANKCGADYNKEVVKDMNLNETTNMMVSEEYKERFKAEYWQAKIRYDKLDAMTVKYEAGTLNFTPSCSLELLKEQKKHMGNYIRCLRIRAEIEKIDLEGCN